MPLTLDTVSDGFRVLSESGHVVAHVQARWPDSDHADHVVTWEPLPRADWNVRLNGTATIEVLEAVLALLPRE